MTTYTWDFESRLASVALPAGTSVTNSYLPNNRIIHLADNAGHLTTLTYDVSGANLLRRDVGGNTAATEHYTQPPSDFGGLLGQYSTAAGGARFYLPDMSSNAVLLANAATVSERHLFMAFGMVQPGSSAPTNQPYGFGGNAGYYTDPISGLQIAWNRVYDANIGQWLSVDPSGFDGGDWNLYRYVVNNPTRLTDPMGLDDEEDEEKALECMEKLACRAAILCAIGVVGGIGIGVVDKLRGRKVKCTWCDSLCGCLAGLVGGLGGSATTSAWLFGLLGIVGGHECVEDCKKKFCHPAPTHCCFFLTVVPDDGCGHPEHSVCGTELCSFQTDDIIQLIHTGPCVEADANAQTGCDDIRGIN